MTTTTESILMIAGPVAFVLTATNIVLGFQVLFKTMVAGIASGKQVRMLFLLTGVVSHVAWLIHLWPTRDLFVRTALVLEIISGFVLLVQAIAYRNHQSKSI